MNQEGTMTDPTDALAALLDVADAAQDLVGSIELGERHALTLAAASKVNQSLAALGYPVDAEGLVDFDAARLVALAAPVPEPEHEPEHWPHTDGSGRWCVACSPIEKAKRAAPVPDGLRALEDAIHALTGGDLPGGLTAVRVARERLALAATPPAPPAGLDVERLARALHAAAPSRSWPIFQKRGVIAEVPYSRFAEAIATEYARLAAGRRVQRELEYLSLEPVESIAAKIVAIEDEATAEARAAACAEIRTAVEGLPTTPFWSDADSDHMCPNCVTPWRCNGPHEAFEREPDGHEVDRAAVFAVINEVAAR